MRLESSGNRLSEHPIMSGIHSARPQADPEKIRPKTGVRGSYNYSNSGSMVLGGYNYDVKT